MANSDQLFLVKIANTCSNGTEKYFGVSIRNGNYIFKGIFQAKNISQVETFFRQKILPIKDSILIWGMDNHPARGWATNDAGKIIERMGEGRPRGNTITPRIAAIGHKVDYVQDPDACTDWYWVYYDPDFGFMWDYLYSSGNCSIREGGGPPPPSLCDQAQTSFDEFQSLSEAFETDDEDVSNGSSGSGLYRPKNPIWICLTNSPLWYARSTESGTVKYVKDPVDTTLWRWEWATFVHKEVKLYGPPLGAGTVVVHSDFGTPSFVPPPNQEVHNILYAGMQVDFSLEFRMMGIPDCPLLDIAIHPWTKQFTRNKIFDAIP